ncbi:PAS domain-containing protein [Mucilaginibacter sp. AW1-3]
MPEKINTSLADKNTGKDSFADHYLANEQLLNLLESTNTGLWERNIITNDAWWSPKFCQLLGYDYGELELSYSFFINHLVHPDERELVYDAFKNHLIDASVYKVEFRILTKHNGYCWFESSGKAWPDENGKLSKMIGAVTDIDQKKRYELELKRNQFILSETNKIANIGGWELNTDTKEVSWSQEISDLDDIPSASSIHMDKALKFFEADQYTPIINAVNDAIELCKPFDLELKFHPAGGEYTWLRVKGIPVINDEGRCSAVRGIFQDINEIKTKELNLQTSLDILSDQNKRLQNFAHIVSHNLRSHSGNLQFMVNIFDEDISVADRTEIFNNIRSISESLATTIDHLNEIVKIQTEISKDLKPVDLALVFKNTQNALDTNISDTRAIICCDFSRCPVVNYVPAYLESIFLNLLTNSLKYRQPGRKPQIVCNSYMEDGHPYITFEDNGSGIDLDKHGDKVFGMYKTFHQNINAKGIGLFITRNQVESLGGTIIVESTVNVGTKFTIKLV